jgi:hypothetical protein
MKPTSITPLHTFFFIVCGTEEADFIARALSFNSLAHTIKISDARDRFFAGGPYGSFIPCPQLPYDLSASFQTPGLNSGKSLILISLAARGGGSSSDQGRSFSKSSDNDCCFMCACYERSGAGAIHIWHDRWSGA